MYRPLGKEIRRLGGGRKIRIQHSTAEKLLSTLGRQEGQLINRPLSQALPCNHQDMYPKKFSFLLFLSLDSLFTYQVEISRGFLAWLISYDYACLVKYSRFCKKYLSAQVSPALCGAIGSGIRYCSLVNSLNFHSFKWPFSPFPSY